jgi:hypothetical protein
MDFGWGAQVFWVVLVAGVIGAIWFGKRNLPPPTPPSDLGPPP